MKRRFLIFICILSFAICLCACTGTGASSTFSIEFIDVGQGDSALVECDGHYMLIDGGEVQAGDKVYRTLEEKGIQKLDILVMSHPHSDHIGGLIKALSYASSEALTLSNVSDSNSEVFRKVEQQLGINEAKITVPHIGDVYKLGSADVEVVDVASAEPNDSLVLLITYGNTRFLFTGDIQYSGQKRLADKYDKGNGEAFKVNLIKMPHHGSWGPPSGNDNDLNRLMLVFDPDYAVISVGAGNTYGHPNRETLELLDQAEVKVYRTDQNGDITVKSDGKTLSFTTSK